MYSAIKIDMYLLLSLLPGITILAILYDFHRAVAMVKKVHSSSKWNSMWWMQGWSKQKQ